MSILHILSGRRLAPVALSIVALAAAPAQASAQTVIGFESSENYTAGQTVAGQPSSGPPAWTAITGTGNREVVTASGSLTAPHGDQFLRLVQTVADHNEFSTTFKFTNTPLAGNFSISALLAYSGIFDNAYIVFSNSTVDYRGVQVGFIRDGSTIRFAYRNGETWTAFGPDAPTPEENTFYRFSVDIHSAASPYTYTLTISDFAGNELTSVSASVRGGVSEFDLVAIKIFKAAIGNNALYVDDIRIGYSSVPEPSSVALLCGLFVLTAASVASRRR